MNPRCELCDEIGGGTANCFHERYGDKLDCRIAASSRNFVIMPSLGQIVPGYVIILPKRHEISLARLTLGELRELGDVVDHVRSILGNHYSAPVLFEHGMKSVDSNNGCGVYHAHLHAAPLADSVGLIDSSRFRRISGLEGLLDFAETSYLYFADQKGSHFVKMIEKLPSQWMRRALASAVGVQDWDWRQTGQEDELVETLRRVRRNWEAQSPIGV